MKSSRFLGTALLVFSASVALADGPFYPLPKTPPTPKDNPTTKDKVELGKQLFFDPRVSLDGSVSCNSCHNVMAGGADGRPVAIGVNGKKGGRNSPTVWNSAFQSVQFWDGREPDLEGQAKGPMINPVEMASGNHELILRRIKNVPGYVSEFKKVFPGKDINLDTVTKAIAAYERTLITPNAPYDRYLRGDKKAISKEAERGGELVKKAGCIACHRGVNYSGPETEIGKGFYQRFPTIVENNEYVTKYKLNEDLGRFVATQKEEDKNMWRVPTWRNIALTAPYFHNGSVKTLDEAVRVMGKTQLAKTFTDEEVKDIVAFLNSLTGEFPAQTMPRLPETPNTSSLID